LVLLPLLEGCGDAPAPPSILLFVSDTTRADAISAYAEVEGTTPRVDALAREGVLFRRAYANAPWTLPSHTTLFTGLLPQQHGVGWQGLRVPDDLDTLAELLQEAGYQTLAITENGWISETFNLAQGFERYRRVLPRARNPEYQETGRDPVTAVLVEWLAERDPERPLFVFVNIVDAHWPWQIRDRNSFLPPAVSNEDARSVVQWVPEYFCSKESLEHEWAVQRGLYLGEVNEADRRFGEVQDTLAAAGLESGLISVFTSDHGEHFGEHHLAGHQFSLHEALLRVPLVVHGIPDAAPAVIDQAVQLADLFSSILSWAGIDSPTGGIGRPLPLRPDLSAAARPILAHFRDPDPPYPDEPAIARRFRAQTRVIRGQCAAQDRVWGDMSAIILPPYKLISYDRFPPELFDLDADPEGLVDISAQEPELTRKMERALQGAALGNMGLE